MDKKINALKNFLKKQRFVRFAYIFGSYARNDITPLSDVDIAVYLDKGLSKAEMHEKEMFLINEIQGILEACEFDVVILNNLDIAFCFNVIRGIPLKSSSDMKTFEFEVMRIFLDIQYHENLMADIALERISRRGLL